MGFMDKLGENVGKTIKEAKNTYDSTKDRASNMSDKQVYNRFKDESGTNTSSMARKMAYMQELKDRGYGNN